MSFSANVLRVMIASPSDIPDARDAVERAIYEWNNANAKNKQIVLMPWRWETSSVPVLGDHPQSLINAQGVDDSDIVIALFGSRLGSPTPAAASGTAEEIQRAVDAGKPVHVYFSTAPLPRDVDTVQLDGLRQFQAEIGKGGLLGEFGTAEALNHEVWKAIEHDIAQAELGVPMLSAASRGVKLLAQPRQEREVKDFDKKGKPRYTTRHWIEITNSGDEDATDVEFEVVGEHSSMMLMNADQLTTIHAGQTRELHLIHHGGGGDPDMIRIRWKENGKETDKEFNVG